MCSSSTSQPASYQLIVLLTVVRIATTVRFQPVKLSLYTLFLSSPSNIHPTLQSSSSCNFLPNDCLRWQPQFLTKNKIHCSAAYRPLLPRAWSPPRVLPDGTFLFFIIPLPFLSRYHFNSLIYKIKSTHWLLCSKMPRSRLACDFLQETYCFFTKKFILIWDGMKRLHDQAASLLNQASSHTLAGWWTTSWISGLICFLKPIVSILLIMTFSFVSFRYCLATSKHICLFCLTGAPQLPLWST